MLKERLKYLFSEPFADMKPIEAMMMRWIGIISIGQFYLHLPFAVFTICMAIFQPNFIWNHRFQVVWASGELIHFLLAQSRLPRLQMQRESNDIDSQTCLNLCKILANQELFPTEILQGWLRRPSDNFTLSDMSLWLAWAFFNKDISQLDSVQLGILEEMKLSLSKKTNYPMGSSNSQPCIRPTVDPVNYIHKPLLFYLITTGLQIIGNIILNLINFKWYNIPNSSLSYYIHEPKRPMESEELPIVFIHGLGIGLITYTLNILAILRMHRNRRIILLCVPHISMLTWDEIVNRDETIEAIDTMLKILNIPRCSFVSHSFGSIISAWLLQFRPHLVAQLTLIDPISFRSWDSTLCRSFLYDPPNCYTNIFMKFFLREPCLAHTVSRNYIWHRNLLLPSHLVCPTRIYLSKYDWLIDAKGCYDYLKHQIQSHQLHHVNLTLLEKNHAAYLLDSDLYLNILAKI